MLASKSRGTLYIGVTSNLPARLYQHRMGATPGFTTRYDVHHLVWFEACDTMEVAISREKQLKRWHRPWKINLIEQQNPEWHDLGLTLCFEPHPAALGTTPKPTRHLAAGNARVGQ
jgi:putative endonuclease